MEIINSIINLIIEHYMAMPLFIFILVVIKLLSSIALCLLNKRQDKKRQRDMEANKKKRKEDSRKYVEKLIESGLSREDAEKHASEILKLAGD